VLVNVVASLILVPVAIFVFKIYFGDFGLFGRLGDVELGEMNLETTKFGLDGF
jgi:hypothetical protein